MNSALSNWVAINQCYWKIFHIPQILFNSQFILLKNPLYIYPLCAISSSKVYVFNNDCTTIFIVIWSGSLRWMSHLLSINYIYAGHTGLIYTYSIRNLLTGSTILLIKWLPALKKTKTVGQYFFQITSPSLMDQNGLIIIFSNIVDVHHKWKIVILA